MVALYGCWSRRPSLRSVFGKVIVIQVVAGLMAQVGNAAIAAPDTVATPTYWLALIDYCSITGGLWWLSVHGWCWLIPEGRMGRVRASGVERTGYQVVGYLLIALVIAVDSMVIAWYVGGSTSLHWSAESLLRLDLDSVPVFIRGVTMVTGDIGRVWAATALSHPAEVVRRLDVVSATQIGIGVIWAVTLLISAGMISVDDGYPSSRGFAFRLAIVCVVGTAVYLGIPQCVRSIYEWLCCP